MANDFEGKCYVKNGEKYVSWETVQDELGLKHMELMRLLGVMGWNWMLKNEFDGKIYFDLDYAKSISRVLDALKAKGKLHMIQWKLPEC